MKKFKVNVKEVLSRVVEIDAESKEEAIEKAEDMYCNEEIVLNYSDFVDEPEIEIISEVGIVNEDKRKKLMDRIDEVTYLCKRKPSP